MLEKLYLRRELRRGLVSGNQSAARHLPSYRFTRKGVCRSINFDVYRIGDIEEMDEIGYEDYFYGNGLCMIEWANLIEEILPEKRHDISIEKDLEKGFDYRKITIRELD